MTSVLVVNSGSSSLKYQLVDPADGSWSAKGLIERIGEPEMPDHASALAHMLRVLSEQGSGLRDLVAVGHRVVHGGSEYSNPVVVDAEVEATIESLIPLAPLHNPSSLLGIRELRRLLPRVPHVAVFDTAFHSTMPPEARTYALPRDLAAVTQVRRYGFHGTSYRYVTRRAAEYLGMAVPDVNLVICHLGNGASMAAIRGGCSVDTTMGLTPLQGLVMGTRSGDLDPAVVFHLVRVGGLTLDEVDTVLNVESGLRGLAGSSDMREVRASASRGDVNARLALDVYAYRIRGYVGAYLAAVPGVHALVFTAGIGEHDAALRREVCDPLSHLGLRLDDALNDSDSLGTRAIDDRTGPMRILVVPTNEEAEIARQAVEAIGL
jgi:acetate kinase